ncbi:hypothetical protein COV11_04555 [Candidatus Woesearchaeota archaeon CG10_big_fil_rev_8_21_14_0_10_30_7]|nr:MAG: hypothetical protein COV11_04555 [Candidatus Woesearchaeota archaeon CG10_big_fil_rev_8_21_14_0_10_30_7]
MSIDDLVKNRKKIELLQKYLGIIQELQKYNLSQEDATLLANYSKQLGINLKYELQDLELMKEELVQGAQKATGYEPLSDAEKIFIQELEAGATIEELVERDEVIAKLELTEQQTSEKYEKDKNEIRTMITELDSALEEVMHETFINIESMKRKYSGDQN